ncbi:GFA family protein [Chelativorans salis]|uniref:GFA family protein n=1 Tax=Chelativorans salis TaxID=2978478 RepID=A0ABT2LM92_9HYPH|nr:GFA family protein [Chelativorans sp. EGI FJ00035]MCT7375700.1 GFA family protein [Chelativorans sp. EGI FJ00035]
MSKASSSQGFSGGCLCSAVRYRSKEAPMIVGHCHCVDCRKSSGTGHCTHIVVPAQGFSVTGEVKFYSRPADSGNVVNRGFCPNCGSAVYSTNEGMPDLAFLRASSLDDPEMVTPAMVVYASRAPSWDYVEAGLPSFATHPEGGPGRAIAAQAGGSAHGL